MEAKSCFKTSKSCYIYILNERELNRLAIFDSIVFATPTSLTLLLYIVHIEICLCNHNNKAV